MAARTSGKAPAASGGGKNRLGAGIGKDLADEWACTRAAADHNPLYRSARPFLRIHDLAKAIADAAQSRDIECDEIVEVPLHAKPGDDSPGMGIRERRAVAEEFRDDMQATGELDRLGGI